MRYASIQSRGSSERATTTSVCCTGGGDDEGEAGDEGGGECERVANGPASGAKPHTVNAVHPSMRSERRRERDP